MSNTLLQVQFLQHYLDNLLGGGMTMSGISYKLSRLRSMLQLLAGITCAIALDWYSQDGLRSTVDYQFIGVDVICIELSTRGMNKQGTKKRHSWTVSYQHLKRSLNPSNTQHHPVSQFPRNQIIRLRSLPNILLLKLSLRIPLHMHEHRNLQYILILL